MKAEKQRRNIGEKNPEAIWSFPATGNEVKVLGENRGATKKKGGNGIKTGKSQEKTYRLGVKLRRTRNQIQKRGKNKTESKKGVRGA